MTNFKSLRFDTKMTHFEGDIKSDRASTMICNPTVEDGSIQLLCFPKFIMQLDAS